MVGTDGHGDETSLAFAFPRLWCQQFSMARCTTMKATKLFHDKATLPNRSIVEMTIWQLATASPERPHGLKRSMYYGRGGERLVGHDNERGKGDHKQLAGRELRYRFVSVEQLVADVRADIDSVRQDKLQRKE